MNDEKKIGFSVELENNRVDLWAHGDDETLVNLAVAALANIVAAACQNAEGAKALLQDVKIGLDVALEQRWNTPPRKSTRKTSRLSAPLICPQSLSGKLLRRMKLDFGGKEHGRPRNVFHEREVPPDV